jgi:hydrogenase maturation protease
MSARAVVAGVGNVFLCDDGFGVEVARRLAAFDLPADVAVIDVGVRGLHLAYELLHGPELLVVVDAVRRGGPPGTLYVIEPDLDADVSEKVPEVPDGHGMDLRSVFVALERLGGEPVRTVIIGCEPLDLAEGMDLSAPVRSAIEPALQLVEDVIRRELCKHSVDVDENEASNAREAS